MAQAAAAHSRLSPPPPDAQVRRDLVTAWEAIRAASTYVQQLDQLVVHHDRWAHAYTSATQLLDAGADRISTWSWTNPRTGRHIAQPERLRLSLLSRLTLAAVRDFQWADAQGWLFAQGAVILAIAAQLGVEL